MAHNQVRLKTNAKQFAHSPNVFKQQRIDEGDSRWYNYNFVEFNLMPMAMTSTTYYLLICQVYGKSTKIINI